MLITPRNALSLEPHALILVVPERFPGWGQLAVAGRGKLSGDMKLSGVEKSEESLWIDYLEEIETDFERCVGDLEATTINHSSIHVTTVDARVPSVEAGFQSG